MDMSTFIKYIEVDNLEHREALELLFQEYSSGVSATIDSTIVNQLFALPYFHGFLCFTGNKPLGFAVCFESYSTYRARKVLNIHDFMISSNSRGKGLGKLLLKGIEAYCRENDYLKITLEVDDDNLVAKQLYGSCDYEDYQVALMGLNHWQKYLV
ncbi:Acetyltransferase, gnat family [Moritella viscosa]|uniref:Acetyltransferase, gnat family n=2 Tax=Moritella viscosa TaxID=80854 RepID=A0ABY1HMN7_9GAMM|nr:Acetyltransferase, gnat family [Moritella viscosa]